MSGDSRYILSKKIARGGMAEIYMAKQIGEDGFHRICCVKRILPHYATDREFIEMFRDEARICQRLQHANIVRVEDFQEVDGSWAIIMEFVNGQDLRSLLSACEKATNSGGRPTRLATPMAMFIAAEVARGLHYSHNKVDEITNRKLGIVHRDISPQNILVSYQGEVKITDFGIANAESRITETKPGVVKGKYAYMSPEQISAKPVDQRTDVFALGIVLWEMLAMERLFFGENEVATIQLVKNCRISKDLRKLNSSVDPELFQIVSKALKKDVRERFQDCEQFEKALRKHLNKHFPEFSANDLSGFISKLMAHKKEESIQNIKNTLTNSEQKPRVSSSGAKAAPAQSQPVANSQMQEIEFKSNEQNSIQIKGGRGNNVFAPGGIAPGNRGFPGGSRPSDGSYRRMEGRSARKMQVSTNFLLTGIAGLAMTMAAIVYFAKSDFAEPATVEIGTTPKVVRMNWNDKPLFNGKYVQTPKTLTGIVSGRHKLKVFRKGFVTEILDLNLASGQVLKKEVVLKSLHKMAPTVIEVSGSNKKTSTLFNIEDGLVSGLIPGRAENLPYGRPYTMVIMTQKPFSCKFTPKSNFWTDPFRVIVDLKRRRCRFKNPRYLGQ